LIVAFWLLVLWLRRFGYDVLIGWFVPLLIDGVLCSLVDDRLVMGGLGFVGLVVIWEMERCTLDDK